MKSSLSEKTLEIAVHALITSLLDYCNSLYHDIPKHSILLVSQLENVNLIMSLILKSMHWLPVHFRIQFKNLLCF